MGSPDVPNRVPDGQMGSKMGQMVTQIGQMRAHIGRMGAHMGPRPISFGCLCPIWPILPVALDVRWSVTGWVGGWVGLPGGSRPGSL